MYLSIYLSIYESIYLSIYLPTYLSISLSVCLCVCLSASRATDAYKFLTSELVRVDQDPHAFNILSCTCVSRHSRVQFFDIRTSKSNPIGSCFYHFVLQMCFPPQLRVIFRHLNFQKWSKPGVFCTFRLETRLRAAGACNFSTSQLPKVVGTWCVLYILT